MSFVISGLDPARFRHLRGASSAELATIDALRVTADSKPGYPCRVTLEDAEPGETLLLLNYEHLPVANPYRARHAIFVREGAEAQRHCMDEIPEQLATRLLSVRAFDCFSMIADAEIIAGNALKYLIERYFEDSGAEFLHLHNAARGCYLARVNRA